MSALLNVNPVVLIHGFTDVLALSGSWKVVEKVLGEMGVEYYTPGIPALGSIEERSTSLIKRIASKYPGRTVHLFGHSMGGLNARDIASRAMKSNLGFQIRTVTTFGTPLRGVKMINPVPGMKGSHTSAVNIRELFGTDFGGLGNLTHNFMSQYNRKTVNNPSVRYFSWAAETSIPTALFMASFPSSRLFGPTDGLVNVDSAEWGTDLGPGTHLGTLCGMDHLTIIGRTTVAATVPHLLAAENGRTAVVRPVNNRLVHDVGRRVEGAIHTALAPSKVVLGVFGLRF